MDEERSFDAGPIICKTATTGRFLDFQDNLFAVQPGEYAQLHGTNFKDYGIKITCTNYKLDQNGNKQSSETAYAHCAPEIFSQIHEVCKKNMGVVKLQSSERMKACIKALSRLQFLYFAVAQLVSALTRGMGEVITKGADIRTVFGSALKQCNQRLRGKAVETDQNFPTEIPELPPVLAPGWFVDYDMEQCHVNVHRQGQDGFCPVACIKIWRAGIRKDGAIANQPWAVRVQRYEAKPIRNEAKGTVEPDNSTKRNEKTAWIQITDEEMFRCTYRIEHFVTVWENAISIPYVRAAVEQRARDRITRQN